MPCTERRCTHVQAFLERGASVACAVGALRTAAEAGGGRLPTGLLRAAAQHLAWMTSPAQEA